MYDGVGFVIVSGGNVTNYNISDFKYLKFNSRNKTSTMLLRYDIWIHKYRG